MIINLKEKTTLTGVVTNGTLTIDSDSFWNVRADSTLVGLDVGGVDKIAARIIGNGHTVYHDGNANSALEGKIYDLGKGGKLTL